MGSDEVRTLTQWEWGYQSGLQAGLDIVNRAADYARDHPETTLDVWEFLARIVTDIELNGFLPPIGGVE